MHNADNTGSYVRCSNELAAQPYTARGPVPSLTASPGASPAFAELITTAPVITLTMLPLTLRSLLAPALQIRSDDKAMTMK